MWESGEQLQGSDLLCPREAEGRRRKGKAGREKFSRIYPSWVPGAAGKAWEPLASEPGCRGGGQEPGTAAGALAKRPAETRGGGGEGGPRAALPRRGGAWLPQPRRPTCAPRSARPPGAEFSDPGPLTPGVPSAAPVPACLPRAPADDDLQLAALRAEVRPASRRPAQGPSNSVVRAASLPNLPRAPGSERGSRRGGGGPCAGNESGRGGARGVLGERGPCPPPAEREAGRRPRAGAAPVGTAVPASGAGPGVSLPAGARTRAGGGGSLRRSRALWGARFQGRHENRRAQDRGKVPPSSPSGPGRGSRLLGWKARWRSRGADGPSPHIDRACP